MAYLHQSTLSKVWICLLFVWCTITCLCKLHSYFFYYLIINYYFVYHIVLFCIVLYYVVFYCTILYCIILCCILLYYFVLYFIILYCIVLFCIVFYYIVLYCIILYCIILFCILLYYFVLYFIILYCIVLFCIVLYYFVLYCIILYCIIFYIVLIRVVFQILVTKELLSPSFYSVFARCLLDPVSVGFNMTDLETIEKLPDIIQSFLSTLLRYLPNQKPFMAEQLRRILSSRSA